MSHRPGDPAQRGRRRALLVTAFAVGTILASGAAEADSAGNGGGGPAGGAFMSSYSNAPYGYGQRAAPAFEPPATGSLAPFPQPPRSEPRRPSRRR